MASASRFILWECSNASMESTCLSCLKAENILSAEAFVAKQTARYIHANKIRGICSMETVIAACGLICSRCDAFRATKENDPAKFELVAADWRKRYNCQEITADNIHCTGCMVEGGPKCGHCETSCEVRQCARAKKVSHCGECHAFPCGKISALHGFMKEQGEAQKKLLMALREVKGLMHSAF